MKGVIPHPNIVTLHQAFAQLEGCGEDDSSQDNHMHLPTSSRSSVRWERLVQSVFVSELCHLGTLQVGG